jgi:hypothetical protein
MNRSEALLRAQRLITLACDPGAAEGESRNAAVAACKLIREFELLMSPVIDPPIPRVPHVSPISSTVPVGSKILTARFRGQCKECVNPILVGDRIWFHKGAGYCAHLRCGVQRERKSWNP